MKEVIRLKALTKDYGENRGIFDLDFSIYEGEMVGFAGTNGSGKTTTIRSIMGFIKPTSGHASVLGLESWTHASEIAKSIGYVPGEIAFPDLPTGIDFLKCQAEFLGVKNMDYANSLIERLQLDPRANLKRMSKGMKQKTALVAALMGDAPVIVLDEPTTGLDPLMRVTFMDIIKDEHKRGKTVFMSSHMFEEIEDSCDKVALISDGRIEVVADMNDIIHRKEKYFKVEFNGEEDFARFAAEKFEITRIQRQYNQYTVKVRADATGEMLRILAGYDVKFIAEIPYTLENHFKRILFEKKEAKNNVQQSAV